MPDMVYELAIVACLCLVAFGLVAVGALLELTMHSMSRWIDWSSGTDPDFEPKCSEC